MVELRVSWARFYRVRLLEVLPVSHHREDLITTGVFCFRPRALVLSLFLSRVPCRAESQRGCSGRGYLFLFLSQSLSPIPAASGTR